MSEMEVQDDISNENVVQEKEMCIHIRKKHLLEADKKDVNPKCNNSKIDDKVEDAEENSESLEKNEKLVLTKAKNVVNSESQIEDISDNIENNPEITSNKNDAGESLDNEGIIIKIVKEKGNLKITSKNKRISFCEKDSPAVKRDRQMLERLRELEEEHLEERLNGEELLFLCCICAEWKCTLKELLGHVKKEHKETQIPPEYELLLNKQQKAILNIEATAKELISMKKYKAVSRLLNSSKISLKSFNLDLFGLGEVNIFDKLISKQFARIKNALEHHKQSNAAKKTLKNRSTKRKENGSKYRRRKKSTRKVSNMESASSGFSSGDDVCLKNIVSEDLRKIKSDGEIVGGLEPEAEEICLQFYAVPFKTDGDSLNTTEVDKLRFIVKNIWNDEWMNLDALADIKIKRFEKEVDEVLPEDTIFCGYLAKENKHLLDETVAFKDLFNDKCLLNDEIRTHKRREIEIKIDRDEGNLLIYEDEIKKLEINGDYLKSDQRSDEDPSKFNEFLDEEDEQTRFKSIEEPASSDNYDDGFNKETAYLAEHPDVLFKNKTLSYKGLCKVCGDRFTSKTDFQKHADLHKNMFLLIVGDQFSCKMCGIRLSESRLLIHYEKNHRFTIVCEVCEERFDSFDERSEHFKLHESLACGVCRRRFEDVFCLRDHFQVKHADRQKFKDETVEPSESPIPKKTIKFSKSSSKAPICGVCGRKFTSVGRLQQHHSILHGGMSFRKNKLPVQVSKAIGQDDVKYEVEID